MVEQKRLEILEIMYIDTIEFVMAPRGYLNKESLIKISKDKSKTNDAIYQFKDKDNGHLWRSFFIWSPSGRAGCRYELYIKLADKTWHKVLEDFIDVDR